MSFSHNLVKIEHNSYNNSPLIYCTISPKFYKYKLIKAWKMLAGREHGTLTYLQYSMHQAIFSVLQNAEFQVRRPRNSNCFISKMIFFIRLVCKLILDSLINRTGYIHSLDGFTHPGRPCRKRTSNTFPIKSPFNVLQDYHNSARIQVRNFALTTQPRAKTSKVTTTG